MKSKLQLTIGVCLLFTSMLSAQIWETVSTAPNTNPKYIATTVGTGTLANPSGKIYVAYVDDSDNDHLKVMYNDGTSWNNLGGTVSTSGNVSFPDIKINPNTNEIWVAYRTDPTTGDGQLMVKSFDGTNWVVEGNDIGYDSEIPTEKIILQFRFDGHAYIASIYEASGVQRKAAIVSNRTGSWADEILLTNNLISYGLDFPSYEDAHYAQVPNGSGVQATTVFHKKLNVNYQWNTVSQFNTGNTTCIGLGSFTTNPYFTSITFEDSSNLIKVGNVQTDLTNGEQIDGNSIQTIKGNNSLYYLLYTDTTGDVFVHEFDPAQVDAFNPLAPWTKILNGVVNVGSTTTLAKLATDYITGQIYMVHKNGTSISLKEFLPNQSYDRIYVDADATGNNDGSSWADAFTDLQTGISAAENTNEKSVWVAEGTYTPDGSDRSVSFTFPRDVSLYGGFDGTETTLNERDWRANETIISGDLNGDDTANLAFDEASRLDNSRTVIELSNTSNVLIDGIVVSGGHANTFSSNVKTYRGAAIFADNAKDITLKHMTIENNIAGDQGAVRFYNSTTNNSTFTVESCTVRDNLSTFGSSLTFITENNNITQDVEIYNSLFYNNIAKSLSGYSRSSFSGSALNISANYLSTQNVTIVNNTFTQNKDFGTATTDPRATVILRRYGRWDNANALGNLNAEFYNNVFADNFTDVGVTASQDICLMNFPDNKLNSLIVDHNRTTADAYLSSISNNFSGTNIQDVPNFEDASNFDFKLQSNSALIDAGDNAQVPSTITVDLAGNNRIENTAVDLGAFEYSGTLSIDAQNLDSNIKVYPNPVSTTLNVDVQTSEVRELRLFDISGKEVISSKSQSIDVSSLSKGLYFVKILTTNDREVGVRKIIKH